MQHAPHRWLKSLGVLALVLWSIAGLSACSSNSTQATRPPTATAGDIQLTVDRTQYDSHTPIGVTVNNSSGNDYYAITGRSACTFLQLQEFDSSKNTWVSVFGCTGASPAPLKIPKHFSEPFTLAPNSPNDPNSWDPGTYRVALVYSSQADGSNATNLAFSPGFQIVSG